MAELRLPGALRPAGPVHRGMAGAGRQCDRSAGPGNQPRIRGRGPQRNAASALAAGRSLARRCIVALALALAATSTFAQLTQISSSRIWPAQDYTRVTLESTSELRFSLFGVK